MQSYAWAGAANEHGKAEIRDPRDDGGSFAGRNLSWAHSGARWPARRRDGNSASQPYVVGGHVNPHLASEAQGLDRNGFFLCIEWLSDRRHLARHPQQPRLLSFVLYSQIVAHLSAVLLRHKLPDPRGGFLAW